MSQRLERDPSNKMIGGVCAGFANYLQVDVTIVRVFFVAAAFLGGFGILAYLALLIIMPLPGQAKPVGDIGEIGRELGDAATAAGDQVRTAFGPAVAHDHERRRVSAGWLLVGLGTLLLLSNVGLLHLDSRVLWPAVVILVGVWLLVRRPRS